MLILAAALLFSAGLMHSVVGGKRLINPIIEWVDLPIILGSIENTRLTLWVGWHLLSVFWWGQAVVLVVIEVAPSMAVSAMLLSLSACSALAGVLALILSRAKHKSWIMFLPLAFITLIKAF
jgi:hypothetical protein